MPRRPRVGLVLSGGGARGFAHIGVLRVLEQLRVPVDVIVGTSMGSVVGGAYAAGRTAAELESFAATTDWAAVLSDRPPRRDADFRRREAELLVPSRIELGISRDAGLRGPPAVVGSQALERALEQLVPAGLAPLPAASLGIPFRAVATDLRTGELVELVDVPLSVALRASLSVPGLFAPLAHGGRILVDGGLVRNIPVDLARALGAEVLIVVNVGTPVDYVRDLDSAFGVAQQMINVLTEQNAQRSLRDLQSGDVLIQPDLGDLASSALATGAAQAIAAGQASAQALAERLITLSVSESDWRAFEQMRTSQGLAQDVQQEPARFQIRSTTRYSAEWLAASAGVRLGQPVDRQQARAAADRLYASGEFERVEVQSVVLPDGRTTLLVPVPAPWRTNPLRVGLEMQTEHGNREDATRFTAIAMGSFNALNAWGAEARVLLRLGSRTTFMGEWWQPLGVGSPLFAVGSWVRDANTSDVYLDGDRASRLRVAATETRLGAGISLGRAGNLQLGLKRTRLNAKPYFDAQGTSGSTSVAAQVYAQLRLDTLDSVAFPTRGALIQADWNSRSTAGAVRAADLELRGLAGFRVGPWGAYVYADASHGDDGAPLALGGFLRLSGTPLDSLNGASTLLGRLVMGLPIGQMPIGLGGLVRAGFSLELGGISPSGTRLNPGDLRKAGSVFMSVDTRLGPVYLALGMTHRGGQAVYVFLGPFW